MDEELKQKIEKVMSEWEESKAEYNLPNCTILDITDFYTIAYTMAEIIKELTEREATILALLKRVRKDYADKNLSFADNWYAEVESFFS